MGAVCSEEDDDAFELDSRRSAPCPGLYAPEDESDAWDNHGFSGRHIYYDHHDEFRTSRDDEDRGRSQSRSVEGGRRVDGSEDRGGQRQEMDRGRSQSRDVEGRNRYNRRDSRWGQRHERDHDEWQSRDDRGRDCRVDCRDYARNDHHDACRGQRVEKRRDQWERHDDEGKKRVDRYNRRRDDPEQGDQGCNKEKKQQWVRRIEATAPWDMDDIFKLAPDAIRDNMHMALMAVAKAPMYENFVVQYVSKRVRGEKTFWTKALPQMRNIDRTRSIRHAENRLDQDEDILRLCGRLAGQDDGLEDNAPIVKWMDAVLSVKFSLTKKSTPAVSFVFQALRRHQFFRQFRLYLPDHFGKSFCGLSGKETVRDGHCLGTCGVKCCWLSRCDAEWHPRGNGTQLCGAPVKCANYPGKYTFHSCWAYSFRGHLQRASPHGMMIQIEESSGLGDGQKLELDMNSSLKHPLIVFHLVLSGSDFLNDDLADKVVEKLASEVYLCQYFKAYTQETLAMKAVPSPLPTVYTQAMLARCPNGHRLKAFLTYRLSLSECNICKQLQPASTPMIGCPECKYNMCSQCLPEVVMGKCFLLVGSGEPKVNRLYEADGMLNGRMFYKNDDYLGGRVFWDPTSAEWCIDVPGHKQGKTLFSSKSSSQSAPILGWTNVDVSEHQDKPRHGIAPVPQVKVADRLLLEGAGVTRANGEYQAVGIEEGRLQYKNSDDGEMLWDSRRRRWHVRMQKSSGTTLYASATDSQSAPTDGWMVVHGPSAPAPEVKACSEELDPGQTYEGGDVVRVLVRV